MSEFVKVKLAGQTYHVHMDEKTNLARDEAKQRIQTLHRETSRRRKTLENKKITHEQKEEQHRQKVLNQRRAQLMLQTQRYLNFLNIFDFILSEKLVLLLNFFS